MSERDQWHHGTDVHVDWRRLVPEPLRGPRATRVDAVLRRIFLGDWHPVLRDPLDLFRLSFVAGAVVFAIRGDSHATTQLALTALAVFVGVTAVTFYEVYEWIAARWLDQNLFISYADTIADIADGFLGAAVGSQLLHGWTLGRFSSRRPPRARPSA